MGHLLVPVLLFAVSVMPSAGSVLRKTIHADGRKDFIIVKEIKHNQCTCSCSCTPRTTVQPSTTTRKPSTSASFVEEVTKNAENWLSESENHHQTPSTQATAIPESAAAIQNTESAEKSESNLSSETGSSMPPFRIESTASAQTSTELPKASNSKPAVADEFRATSENTSETSESTKWLSDEPISVAAHTEVTETAQTSGFSVSESTVTSSDAEKLAVSSHTTAAGISIVKKFSDDNEESRTTPQKAELFSEASVSTPVAITTDKYPKATSELESTETIRTDGSTSSSDLNTKYENIASTLAVETTKASIPEKQAVSLTYSSSVTRKYREEGMPVILVEETSTTSNISEAQRGLEDHSVAQNSSTAVPEPSTTDIKASSVPGLDVTQVSEAIKEAVSAEHTAPEYSPTITHGLKVSTEAATLSTNQQVNGIVTDGTTGERAATEPSRRSGTSETSSAATTVAASTRDPSQAYTATAGTFGSTVAALEQRMADKSTASAASITTGESQPSTSSEAEQTEKGKQVVQNPISMPITNGTLEANTSETPETNTSHHFDTKIEKPEVTTPSATLGDETSTEQHRQSASTKQNTIDYLNIKDEDFTPVTALEATTPETPLTSVSPIPTTDLGATESEKTVHEKVAEKKFERAEKPKLEKQVEKAQEEGEKLVATTGSSQQTLVPESKQQTTLIPENTNTRNAATTKTEQETKAEDVRMNVEGSTGNENASVTGKVDERSSEIVPKTIKFEEKRSDVVNKTDSSDIYVQTPLVKQSSTQSSSTTHKPGKDTEITGPLTSKMVLPEFKKAVNEEVGRTEERKDKILGESENSGSTTEKSISSENGEGNVTVIAGNKTLESGKTEAVIQKLERAVESKPKIKTAVQIDEAQAVPPSDHKYDVYVRLEKPQLATTGVTQRPGIGDRTTAKENQRRVEESQMATLGILVPLEQVLSTTVTDISSSTSPGARRKPEIGDGESFKVESSHGSSVDNDEDPNEQIRQGWRKALEELRQKLRAYQESLKTKKDEKNNAVAIGRKDEEHGKEGTGTEDSNEKMDGHLYIIQLGLKDLKKPDTIQNNNTENHNKREDNNLMKSNSTNEFGDTIEDRVIEKSGLAEKMVNSMFLKNDTKVSNEQLPISTSDTETTTKVKTDSDSETDTENVHWEPLKSEIHHEKQAAKGFPESTSASTVTSTASEGIEKEMVDLEKAKKGTNLLPNEKLGIDFSIDEQPDVIASKFPVHDIQIPEHDKRIPAQHHAGKEEPVSSGENIRSAINPLELRRKMQEEQNRAVLREIENREFAEEVERKRNLLNEEKEEGRRIPVDARLLEEKARLEQARLLREEQINLEKQQELRRGLADKAQMERQEQIARQLEQLAESERRHREQLEREKLVQLARTKHYRIVPSGDSFSATRTDITTLSEANVQASNSRLLPTTQCPVIRKFARVFQMTDPVEWVRTNCPFATMYFPKASCEHIQQLFETCFQ